MRVETSKERSRERVCVCVSERGQERVETEPHSLTHTLTHSLTSPPCMFNGARWPAVDNVEHAVFAERNITEAIDESRQYLHDLYGTDSWW